MKDHAESDREEALEEIVGTLKSLGFSEDRVRASLAPQIGGNYLRYSEVRRFNEGEMFYTVEILMRGNKPDFRGYKASLVSKEGTAPHSHYFICNGDHTDIGIHPAYNLLCGRSVVSFFLASKGQSVFNAKWTLLRDGIIKTLPDFDLNPQLKSLPLLQGLGTEEGFRIILGLLTGDRVKTTLLADQGEMVVWLEADPENGCLKITDQQGNMLNLHSTLKSSDEKMESKNQISTAPDPSKSKKPKGPKH